MKVYVTNPAPKGARATSLTDSDRALVHIDRRIAVLSAAFGGRNYRRDRAGFAHAKLTELRQLRKMLSSETAPGTAPICRACGAPILLVDHQDGAGIYPPGVGWVHEDLVDADACPNKGEPVPDEEASP